MVCYGPRITTLAITGAVVYVFFHRLIGHILHIAGLIFEITLITCAGAAAVAVLIWTTRRVKRRRAAAGACTQCRYRCQQALIQPGPAGPALAPHRHLPVVQITRRQVPASGVTAPRPEPARPAATTAAPAARPATPVARPAPVAGQPATPAARPGPWPTAVPLPAAISAAASATACLVTSASGWAAPLPQAAAPTGTGPGGDHHAPGDGPARHDDYLLTPV